MRYEKYKCTGGFPPGILMVKYIVAGGRVAGGRFVCRIFVRRGQDQMEPSIIFCLDCYQNIYSLIF